MFCLLIISQAMPQSLLQGAHRGGKSAPTPLFQRKILKNRVEREVGVGIGMGNTCNSMADSCQCMTKPTEML